MVELNGFEIEKFNQYNLREGDKYSTCPICSEHRKPQNQKQKCLMMDWNTGLATCSHCGEVIQLHTYKKKNSNKEYKRPEWKNQTELSDKLVKWFNGRKISQFTLRRLKISEGKEWMPQVNMEINTVQFNYFRDDELINIKYRCPIPGHPDKKGFKMVNDAEKIPYNLDNIRTSKECVIVEGEMDVLSVVEAGYFNCVSSPNGSTTGNVNLEWLDNSIDYFDNKDKIILALDADEPGQNVQKELIRRLGAERCYLVDLSPHKDFNEVLMVDGVDDVKKRISEAKQCPLENVETFKDFENQLYDYFENGDRSGYKIGLESFDANFSTYTSQYIMVTGIPSHGKSDFVDMMTCGYNRKYGWKIAYASPENKPNFLHGRKLFKKVAGYEPKNRIEFDSLKSRKVRDYLNENFFFMEFEKAYDLDDVLNKAKELIVRKGVRCIVIDPFNKVRLHSVGRNDINIYTEEYLNRIDEFCKKWDVLIIIVAHPIKMKKINGVTPEPDFYDVKGGGEWYDMTYHGLCVHRDFTRGLVKIKILKVKFDNLGINQAYTWLNWNANNGRYTEIMGDADDISSVITPLWDNSFWLEEKTTQNNISYEEKSFEQTENEFLNQRDDVPF